MSLQGKGENFFPVTQNKNAFFVGGRMCIFIASVSLPVMTSELKMFPLEVPLLLFGPLHLFKGDCIAETELVVSLDT